MEALFTIGAYGYDADKFVKTLRKSGIDLIVDVRRRRGMRGGQYSWANAVRLQERLAEERIGYLHAKDLAPTQEIREVQRTVDEERGLRKRQRPELSEEFAQAYFRGILEPLNATQTAPWLRGSGTAPALFCVEGWPAACHRSLVAEWLRREGLVSKIIHLTP